MTGNARGLPFALGAYFIWGVLPLYLMLVDHVPALEFVGWRIVFTLPVCLLFVVLRRQGGELLAALRNPRITGLLAISALLIAVNWLIYVAALQAGHIYAASLGYYINPLVNVLAGTVFLGEKLGRRQWLAVGIAAAGVALLAWDALAMLWLGLSLAVTFAGYGLVRKLTPVGSLPGLTIETVLLAIPAIGMLIWQSAQPGGVAFGKELSTDLLLACSGLITATALLLFATAARRMDYSALGFVQYLAPTLVFLIGLLVLDTPLRPVQLACFVLIWTAIAVFSWDMIARQRSSQ